MRVSCKDKVLRFRERLGDIKERLKVRKEVSQKENGDRPNYLRKIDTMVREMKALSSVAQNPNEPNDRVNLQSATMMQKLKPKPNTKVTVEYFYDSESSAESEQLKQIQNIQTRLIKIEERLGSKTRLKPFEYEVDSYDAGQACEKVLDHLIYLQEEGKLKIENELTKTINCISEMNEFVKKH